MKKLQIQLLLTGDELMSGDIVDSNSAMIAKKLQLAGYAVSKRVTVGDDIALMKQEIAVLAAASDVLIVNGGLGPTVDDLTAEVLAQVIGQPLEEHAQALGHLEAWCEKRNFKLDGPNRKQALLPKGVAIVPNPIGSAVGFSVNHNNCWVVCTPGVPSELEKMLDQTILPEIDKRFPTLDKTTVTHLPVFGLGESKVQQMISERIPDWPEEVELGFRASLPIIDVKLTAKSQEGEKARDVCLARLKALLGAHIISEKDETLPQRVVGLLQQQGKTIATAESCTGGLIASQITAIAGASSVFEMGVVSYSNRIKSHLLSVDPDVIEAQGAVSREVVYQMVEGALSQSGSDYAIAVSGVAGPDGGTDEKPVGSVWVAWGDSQNIETELLYFPGPRGYFQQVVAAVGLDLIRRRLLGIEEEPLYFKQRKFKGYR
ncbi:CinA family nicotinamide mononucleotide deamidase-related protein [Alkalimarinus sediminis]|uniref:CinA-like protein n=1 Tax=Alkalimarinus sediminis TaxID=1632866 RepID=A0A9E8HIY0_9ALTE|nr:CinA family nicotinamide mononucleotide deamidase-related protein [Alkalimarinus sediminis]UZW75220.1 CinA family nicotinamide mononucleotide deamidase-related protein [Alkalimarinus sediminis]